MDNTILQVYTTVTVLAVVHSAPVTRIRKSDCNGVDVFWDKVAKNCKKCIFCGTGYRRNISCGGGTGGIVTCIPCSASYFQDFDHFDGIRCSFCTSCLTLNLIEVKGCTSTSNAECGTCKLGFGRDPKLPSNMGCTSCKHLDSSIEGCSQQTITPSATSTTTKRMNTSVFQTTPSRSTALSSTKKTTLELRVNTHERKTENGFPVTLKKGSNKVVIHGKGYVTREVFGFFMAVIFLVPLIFVVWKIMKYCGFKAKLPACRRSEKGGNNNDLEGVPPQNNRNTFISHCRQLDAIPEEQIPNESDSGDDHGPLLKRSLSAPPATGYGVEIDSVRKSVHFKKYGQSQKTPLVPTHTPKKSPDEELMEKTLRICNDQALANLSPEIQSKLRTALNPNRNDCMVQNWRDLAQKLGIQSDIIDNFQDRMGSVFQHMFCTYPDTTMKTFLDAVQGLNRPNVVRIICKSIIDEHEKIPVLISL